MMKLLHNLSNQHSTTFTWNFFATGHGKGVADGIGGQAKSLVRQQVLSKSKNIIVQNAADFAKVCRGYAYCVCAPHDSRRSSCSRET